MRAFRRLAATLLVIAFATSAATQEPSTRAVSLVIDYSDGIQKKFPEIAWRSGMTVLDAMKKAMEGSHDIRFRYTGSGETAFLTEIDGRKNEGGGKQSRNWQYWVNGRYAKLGFGVQTLNAGDKVFWKFSSFQEK